MIKQTISLFLALTFLTGVVYPLFVTLICEVVMPFQSGGSLVNYKEDKKASILVGQNFSEKKYFWGRPSVTAERPYNLMAGTSSNLSNKSKAVIESKESNTKKLEENDYGVITEEMVLASASGLDPHISVESANSQILRISNERKINPDKLKKIIKDLTESPLLGVFGEERVNVFKLNLALDKNS